MANTYDENTEQFVQNILNEALPQQIQDVATKQEEILDALDNHPLDIWKLPNVRSIGVGYQYQNGESTEKIGPRVLVSEKVSNSELSKHEIIPSTLEVRGKTHRIDVGLHGETKTLCIPGVPTVQHIAHDPIHPGLAITPIDPNTGQPALDPETGMASGGTGGLIVKYPDEDDLYMLTAAHVISWRQMLGHPWFNPTTFGPHDHSFEPVDASICKIERANPAIPCIGRVHPPIDPIVGCPVKKSGATTGLTQSYIKELRRERPNTFPWVCIKHIGTHRSIFSQIYTTHGDSGSVSVAGKISSSPDYGPQLNLAIEQYVSLASPPLQNALRSAVQFRINNSAVCLNTNAATEPDENGDERVVHSTGISIKDVLTQMGNLEIVSQI